jgi:hypothetical protein
MDLKKLLAAMEATANEKPRPVEIPGWGTVYVKSLTVEEADIDEDQLEDDKKNRARVARGAAKLICDENGNRLLDPNNPDHIRLLKKQPWSLLRKIIAEPEDAPKGN